MLNSDIFVIKTYNISHEVTKFNRNGWYVTSGFLHNNNKYVTVTAIHVGYRISKYLTQQTDVIDKLFNGLKNGTNATF